MPLTNAKPRLSRQYVYAPLGDLNVDLATATLSRVALMDSPTAEPADLDWVDAIVVTTGHAQFRADIGDAFAVLIGPDRGDAVTTVDLPVGPHVVWSEWRVPGSDERPVDFHGTVEIIAGTG